MPSRKATKKSRRLRKTRGRGRRRTQRGGLCKEGVDAQQVCNEINAAEDIKTATTLYKKAALMCHPDKGGNDEDFKTLGNCFDTKKKSLETGQAPQPAPSTRPATSDRTAKGDLYVYFYRNNEPVDFNTLSEHEQLKVRAAVVYSPLEIHGDYGIVKAPLVWLNNLPHGAEFTVDGITLKLRTDPIGGRRKSRR